MHAHASARTMAATLAKEATRPLRQGTGFFGCQKNFNVKYQPALTGGTLTRHSSHRTAAAPVAAGGRGGGGSGTAVGSPPASPAAGGAAQQLPRVILKGGKSKLFTEQQSPMVYSGAVDRVLGRPAPKSGDVVLVCDGSERPIGWGLYNPASMFRVRMMQLADECFGGQALLQRPDLQQLVAARILQAVALRAALGLRCGPAAAAGQGAGAAPESSAAADGNGSDSGSGTSVFRLLNSEGDRLSGLIVDVLGEHLVVSSSAAWVERHREAITGYLQQYTGLTSIVWRQAVDMLREEGCLPPLPVKAAAAAASAAAAEDGEADPDAAAGASAVAEAEGEEEEHAAASASSSGSGIDEAGKPSLADSLAVVVTENGLKYVASPYHQKTGFYADQRDNRALVRQLAAGLRVLDMCCYSGGFALSAAAGGAASVLGVDSSGPAVELAARNAELNGFGASSSSSGSGSGEPLCSFVRADVADFMRQAVAERRRWDLVVFDPPKLAPSRKALEKATRKYRKLNAQAMKLVEPGGLLMTCSCSGAMSQSGDFVPMLQAAAKDAGRRITVLRVGGAAPDHTLDPAYPEGQYLTNVLLRVL